jgi:hypothetical protein
LAGCAGLGSVYNNISTKTPAALPLGRRTSQLQRRVGRIFPRILHQGKIYANIYQNYSFIKGEDMSKKRIVFLFIALLAFASFSCVDPITGYLSTQTALMQTKTAIMWTPTPSTTLTPTPDSRYLELGGDVDFSYIPPKNWKQNNREELMAWNGPGSAKLRFFSDLYDYTADTLASYIIEYYEGQHSAHCSNNPNLITDNGLSAIWITCINSAANGLGQLSTFLFQNGKGVIVVAEYSRNDDRDEEQDIVVEDCLRTFRFD